MSGTKRSNIGNTGTEPKRKWQAQLPDVTPIAPKQWLVYPAEYVYLSEEGKLATHTADCDYSLVHTGEELTDGRHFW